jgi:hypothetical protein
MIKEFPTQQVLELACAAQRINNEYLKESEGVYASDGQYLFSKQPNKILMLVTLDPTVWTADPKESPMPLKVLAEDIDTANKIRNHYKKLLFAAIDGTNEFLTNINSILNSDTIASNKFGYIACLPSVCIKDIMHTKVKKFANNSGEGFLADIGSNLFDLDAEIIESSKSKNFEGYNISAIINNRMASWINKTSLELGNCVIIKAKVKDHTKHWKHGNDVTRLNYVKAVQ